MKWWKRLLEPIESYLHRRALLAWLDELDEKYGPPSEEAQAWAREVMEEARRPHTDGEGTK
jgi:hypothetical protein